ncbi:MAG: hypothetical protein JST30_15860 [Armatimonadetes bacterium]|nr:hypothetical protein [Armatimonadota bacterium]
MNTNVLTVALVSASAGAVAGGIAAAGVVNLQDTTPGAVQTGHSNISGYSLAGRFGAGVSPTLARIQVKETGGAQGVRSETGSGVALFGKSTAATGLGAGGYFTSSSVGGRGIVGEALSTTGNPVGGLFYNYSNGAGVAVWGRAIGNGAATGVFAETLSGGGTALAAINSGAESGFVAGTGTDSIQTSGPLPRHDYGNTTATMVPIAYGVVFSDGTVAQAGSGNWTSSKLGVGQYNVAIAGTTLGQSTSVILATSVGIGSTETCGVSSGANGTWDVGVHDQNGAAVDSNFHFVIFKATGVGTMPGAVRDKPGSDEKHDADNERRRAAARRHEERSTKQDGYVVPVDHGIRLP